MNKSICFLILAVISLYLYSQSEIKDATEIELDNVAFDKNDLLKILDVDKTIIAYYDRFENKSGLFDTSKQFVL